MRKIGLAFALFISVLVPISHADAVAPKPGTKCSKVGNTQVSKGLRFTCIRKNKQLVWNNGVRLRVATPAPSLTTRPSPTPTVAPSPSPSPTPTVAPSPSATSQSTDIPESITPKLRISNVTDSECQIQIDNFDERYKWLYQLDEENFFFNSSFVLISKLQSKTQYTFTFYATNAPIYENGTKIVCSTL